MIKELKKDLNQICKQFNKKHKQTFETTNFAININTVDGIKPDEDSISIIQLYEKGILDFETAEKALTRLSHAKG